MYLNTKKTRIRRIFSILVPFLMVSVLGGVAFGAMTIGGNVSTSNNISVGAGEAEIDKSMGINITSSTNVIYFDVDGKNSSKEQLDIIIEGGLTNSPIPSSWKAIRPSVSITTTAGQTIFDNLIIKKYLNVPQFDDLRNDSSNGSSLSKWTAKPSTYNWSFKITSSFSYGSFFNNLKPSEFFSSDEHNGVKRGNEYTIEEKNAIYNELAQLNSLSFAVTLRVLTETNGITVNLAAGSDYTPNWTPYFATTTSWENIVYSDLLEGDYIYIPRLGRRDNNVSSFRAYNGNKSYYFNLPSSIDYQDTWVRLGYLRYNIAQNNVQGSKYSVSSITSLIVEAQWESTASELAFRVLAPDSSKTYETPNFTYHLYPKNYNPVSRNSDGTTSELWPASETSGLEKTATVTATVYNTYVSVGDVLSLNITPSSNVTYYKVYGFEGIEDGTILTRDAQLTVNKTVSSTSSLDNHYPRIDILPNISGASAITSASFEAVVVTGDGEGGSFSDWSNTANYNVFTPNNSTTTPKNLPVKVNIEPSTTPIELITYTAYGIADVAPWIDYPAGNQSSYTVDGFESYYDFTTSGTLTGSDLDSSNIFTINLPYDTVIENKTFTHIQYVVTGTIIDGSGAISSISFATNADGFYTNYILLNKIG